jgi:hypothetical protein
MDTESMRDIKTTIIDWLQRDAAFYNMWKRFCVKIQADNPEETMSEDDLICSATKYMPTIKTAVENSRLAKIWIPKLQDAGKEYEFAENAVTDLYRQYRFRWRNVDIVPTHHQILGEFFTYWLDHLADIAKSLCNNIIAKSRGNLKKRIGFKMNFS